MGASVFSHEVRDEHSDPRHLTRAAAGQEASGYSNLRIRPRPHLRVGCRLCRRGQLNPQIPDSGLTRQSRSRPRCAVAHAQIAIHGQPRPNRGRFDANGNQLPATRSSKSRPTRVTRSWSSRDLDVGTRHQVTQSRSGWLRSVVRGQGHRGTIGLLGDFGISGSTLGQSAGGVIIDLVPGSRFRPEPPRLRV